MTDESLLPPNATGLERGLAATAERVSAVPLPLVELWDPQTCPIELLPWLAWGLSVDSWDAGWPEATKRDAVAQSVAEHRIKGTRASVEAALKRLDDLLALVEWHETAPRGTPHTFEVILDIVRPGGESGGSRASAAFADRIIADVMRVKPLREHFVLVQKIAAEALIGIQGAVRVAGFIRQDHDIVLEDDSQPWALLLQTEDGEPLQTDNGDFLEHQA